MKLLQFMGRLRWWKTRKEKEAILKNRLRRFFADHDKVTGKVEIPACLRADDEIRKWRKQGLIDYYYELHVLDIKNIKQRVKLAKKYKIAA